MKTACSRLSDSAEDAKGKGTRKVVLFQALRRERLPSFLPFYFRVCAFSIQRTRLSRSLEQANMKIVYKIRKECFLLASHAGVFRGARFSSKIMSHN